MRQLTRFISALCVVAAVGCGGDDKGDSKSESGVESDGPSGAAGSGPRKSCGTVDCGPGPLMTMVPTGDSCCADASESLCGTKDGAGECKAPKHDSRCPSFMASFGEFPGCCTEDNQCGLDTMGLATWACLPLSEPRLRSSEPGVPEPKACDAP